MYIIIKRVKNLDFIKIIRLILLNYNRSRNRYRYLIAKKK